jgi:hypothetical protein
VASPSRRSLPSRVSFGVRTCGLPRDPAHSQHQGFASLVADAGSHVWTSTAPPVRMQVIQTAARWAQEANAATGDNSTSPTIVSDEMVKTLKELLMP